MKKAKKNTLSQKARKRNDFHLSPLSSLLTFESFSPKHTLDSSNLFYYLIDLMLHTGEVPSDIYKLAGINPGTFRSVIYQLRNSGLIRRNFDNGIHSYLLTYKAKRDHANLPYSLKNTNDQRRRNRKLAMAKLLTFFHGLNVSVFLNRMNSYENIIQRNDYDRVLRFYNSLYLKSACTKHTDKVRQSKAFGLLSGKGKNMMVYFTDPSDFSSAEFSYISSIECMLKQEIDNAIIVNSRSYSTSKWICLLLEFSTYFSGVNPMTLFNNIFFLPMDENAFRSFFTLYNNEKVIQRILSQYDLPGFQRRNNTCIFSYNSKKAFLITNLNFEEIRYAVFYSIHHNEPIYICTAKYLSPIFEAIQMYYKFDLLFVSDDLFDP